MVSPTHCGIKGGLQLDNVNDCRRPRACRITAPVCGQCGASNMAHEK